MISGKSFFALTTLMATLLATPQAWAEVVEDEAVFSQVSRISKKYNNCSNNGNTYNFEVTGLAGGAEKTIKIPYVEPNKPDDDEGGRAEVDMVNFCEKAALLTKSQPDKYDFYIQVKYEATSSGGPNEIGLCTSTSGGGRERGTQLVCELK